MRPAIKVLPAVLFALAPSTALAQDALGFGEVRLMMFPGASGRVWQLIERVCPTLESELADRVKLTATVEAALAQGRRLDSELESALRASDFGPLIEAAGCTWPTHENELFDVDRADDYLAVDRLYLDFYGESFDLRVGRQAINWGSAQFLNPTDPFPEVLLAEPWRPRRGVNAVRANVPFGEVHDLSTVVAVDDTLEAIRAAGRIRLNWAETDFAFAGAWRGERSGGLVGIDFRGTLGVGWWIEGALVLDGDPHEEIAVGLDYSFPVLERLTFFVQYYRNGEGATDPDLYPRAAAIGAVAAPECTAGTFPFGSSEAAQARDPFAPFTAARDYLVLGGSIGILPELSGTLSALQNLDDGTGVVVPTINYNALDWLDLALSAQVPVALCGTGGELKPRPKDLRFTVDPLSVDLGGLIPDATITLWTRASF